MEFLKKEEIGLLAECYKNSCLKGWNADFTSAIETILDEQAGYVLVEKENTSLLL